MYRSGHNGAHSKCVCRETGTWVRIPPSPPERVKLPPSGWLHPFSCWKEVGFGPERDSLYQLLLAANSALVASLLRNLQSNRLPLMHNCRSNPTITCSVRGHDYCFSILYLILCRKLLNHGMSTIHSPQCILMLYNSKCIQTHSGYICLGN